jgi:Ca2+-transporting ATPase
LKKISFETLKGLGKRELGLSEEEVIGQTSRYGANEIIEVTGSPWLDLAKDTFKDPMIWFLVGIGLLFVLVGDVKEAVVLFVAIVPLAVMDAFLHWRTQASTSGLRTNLASQVNVFRGTKETLLDSRKLVPGDLVSISSGTFLPADGVFTSAIDLQVDESVLTGEAFPIQKRQASFDPFALSERGEVTVSPETLGYAGTKALAGHGKLRVLQTGIGTSYGEIVQSVARMPHERTPLQKSITNLVQILIAGAGIFCVVLAGVRIYQGHGWLDAILSAATLAIAAIPEEFPIVFTFFLGVGVYRLAKKKALVRRAVSVENIGRITQICTDKTGTITIGVLKLTHIDPAAGQSELGLLGASLAASNLEGSDPVDRAIQDLALERGVAAQPRLVTFPFTEDRKQETAIVTGSEGRLTAFMKGSPETVLSKSIMSDEVRQSWLTKTKQWAKGGHKVLACAKKYVDQEAVDQRAEPQSGFEFCGLLAFEDPPRKEVAEAISYCRANAIGVLMVTGDHIETASAIARDVGLGGQSPLAASAEAEPEKFQEVWLRDHPEYLIGLSVVARCTPLQKLTIVNALKKSGEIVAVTGDGVNDVPALKAADVGIAMGERGTRSAKEVSSIVLLDDNFSTIVNAIMEGRQLFSNLQKSFEYLLLVHIPLVLTAALIPVAGYPLLYLPIHIVWLELVIHPSALFAFQEKASSSVARHDSKNFFTASDWIRIVTIGVGVAVAIAFTYLVGVSDSSDVGHARSLALVVLTSWSASLLLLLTGCRTRTAIVVSMATIGSSVLLTQVSSISTRLQLSPLCLSDWMTIAGIVIGFTLLTGLWRRFR